MVRFRRRIAINEINYIAGKGELVRLGLDRICSAVKMEAPSFSETLLKMCCLLHTFIYDYPD
jgi:hypothetical protein